MRDDPAKSRLQVDVSADKVKFNNILSFDQCQDRLHSLGVIYNTVIPPLQLCKNHLVVTNDCRNVYILSVDYTGKLCHSG